MDLVGPRYLKGGFKFYFLDIIDVENHFAGVYPLYDKSSKSIASALLKFWSSYGMPDFLQMDNELSFRGSNRYPRSLGLVLRLCLFLGITPIFIPVAEPWRNGIIEKFNHNMQSYFFSKQEFKTFKELEIKSAEFSVFHNNHHRYSSQNNKTPCMIKSISQKNILINIPDINKPIDLINGEIIFIRFIRSNRKINILGTSFIVNKKLVYSYVEAVILVENHALMIRQNNIIWHCFSFIMPINY